jgi:hypothetical protein
MEVTNRCPDTDPCRSRAPCEYGERARTRAQIIGARASGGRAVGLSTERRLCHKGTTRERYRTTVWCPHCDQRPGRPDDRWVCLGRAACCAPVHANSARVKNDLLNQMRSATGQAIQGTRTCSSGRVTTAVGHSPIVLNATNGHTGGPLRRHQLPGLGDPVGELLGLAMPRGWHEPRADTPSWEDTVPHTDP